MHCKYIRLLLPQNEFVATIAVYFWVLNGKMALNINSAFVVWLEF